MLFFEKDHELHLQEFVYAYELFKESPLTHPVVWHAFKDNIVPCWFKRHNQRINIALYIGLERSLQVYIFHLPDKIEDVVMIMTDGKSDAMKRTQQLAFFECHRKHAVARMLEVSCIGFNGVRWSSSHGTLCRALRLSLLLCLFKAEVFP